MDRFYRSLVIALAIFGLCAAVAWPMAAFAQATEQKAAPAKEAPAKEVSKEEVTATVPALAEMHKVVFPLWHQGYANKDFDLIKSLLPKADTLVAAVDAAQLPGILKDKQEKWNAEKANLDAALQGLHKAADANDQEGMLKQAEAFHMSYEGMVRTTRPALPELDAFHQELYKLYHYHMPAYDVAQIKADVAAMNGKMAALKSAKLPKRLEAKQAEFDSDVKELDQDMKQLDEKVKAESKEDIKAAVDKVHAAYQKLEKMFD
jgi:hypothetical protein